MRVLLSAKSTDNQESSASYTCVSENPKLAKNLSETAHNKYQSQVEKRTGNDFNGCSQRNSLGRVHVPETQSFDLPNQKTRKSLTGKSTSHGILKFCKASPRLKDEETIPVKPEEDKRFLRDRKEINYRVDSDAEPSSQDNSMEPDVVYVDSDDSDPEHSSSSSQSSSIKNNKSMISPSTSGGSNSKGNYRNFSEHRLRIMKKIEESLTP